MADNSVKKPRKKPIPKALRVKVWETHVGKDKAAGPCYVCGKEITTFTFEVGHVIAEAKGGKNTIDNLRPVCSLCNKSVGMNNMDTFKTEYGLIPAQSNIVNISPFAEILKASTDSTNEYMNIINNYTQKYCRKYL